MGVHSNHGPRAWRRLATGLLPVALAATIAGCGSSKATGTAADPAGVIPAITPLYAGAVARPEGSLKTAAAAAGQTLTHEPDPYRRLLSVLETPGSAPLDFNRDVAPWLGPRIGIYLSSLSTSGESNAGQLLTLIARGLLSGSSASVFPFAAHGAGVAGTQGAIVMDTSDVAKARSFLESQAKRAGAHASAYRGASLLVTSEGVAFAIVGRFAVIGSEAGVHGVIDTWLGGSSLARSAGYAKLTAGAPAGELAHLFVNPAASGSSLSSHRPTGLLGSLAGGAATDISLVPSGTSIELEADSLSGPTSTTGVAGSSAGGLLASVSEGAGAAGELPGNSWLAIGLGKVGGSLGGDVEALRSVGSLGTALGGSAAPSASTGALSLKGLLDGILAPLALLGANSAEARRDFASWMGPGGIFASGTGLAELRAGIVISSTNPALSRAAVPKLAALLRRTGSSVQPASYPGAEASVAVYLTGLPITLNIVAARDAHGQAKFVIGLGEASVTAALQPSSTLSSAASTNAARAVLGQGIQPSVLIDFTTFLGLLEAVGLSEDPTIAKLVPYLRTFTTLSGGGTSLGGGVERFRLVLGLQKTG